MSRRRRWLLRLAAALLLWWGLGLLTAHVATRPHPSEIVPRAEIGGRKVEDVSVSTTDRLTVRGWLVDVPVDASRDEQRCVILCAGIRGNRQRLLSRAKFYQELGWSTLLVDLRGTGASDGARISMGWHEADDLVAWRLLLRNRGYTKIGVHGQSLGAAAAVYTSTRMPTPPDWSFMVLEACYLDITSALRARLFGLPEFLLWPVIRNAEWLLGVDAEDLSPLIAMRRHSAPTFFVCGTLDDKVGHDATTQLMDALPARDKVHYHVPDVAHKDLWRPGGTALRNALREFLQRR